VLPGMTTLGQYEPFWADFDPPHRDMDRKVAIKAFERLMEQLPQKMQNFERILREAEVPLTGEVHADLSAISDWFAHGARETQYSDEMVAKMRQKLIDKGTPEELVHLGITRWGIDAPTLSMCYYVGFYMCDRFREVDPTCYFALAKDKRNIHYNRAALYSQAKHTEFEPVHMMKVFIYRCLAYGGWVPTGHSLAHLFDIWVDVFAGKTDEAV
jgi:hypothetical protein